MSDEQREELDVNDDVIEHDDVSESDIQSDDIEDNETEDVEATEDEESPADALDFSFDDDDGEESEGDDGDPFKGQPAPDWVKQLRRENRELKRREREREAQQQPQQLGEMPSLADYDYDEDSPEYKAALQKWVIEKQKHDEQVQTEQQKYRSIRDRYEQSVDKIRKVKPDYDDVEGVVIDTLSVEQQGLLQMASDDPATMAYLLGKAPKTLDELSKMDSVQFTKKIGILEHTMANRKTRNSNKPKPDPYVIKGHAGGGDTQLAKLEAEADKTGDRSKVAAYKRKQRNKT